MLTQVADFDLKTRQLDAVNAFLNAFNDESMYCHISNDYRKSEKILKILRALYDQRKSSFLWLRILIKKCIQLELILIFDGFYLFTDENDILMFFYIDNIVFVFRSDREMNAENMIRRMKEMFDVRDLSELKFFLRIRVLQ
jgi:hypothetical protein